MSDELTEFMNTSTWKRIAGAWSYAPPGASGTVNYAANAAREVLTALREARGRRRLPNRRLSMTYTVRHNNKPHELTIGYYPDLTPGEMFVDTDRPGADMNMLAHDAMVVASLALQYGCPLDVIRDAVLRHEAGEPATLIGAIADHVTAAHLRP